LDSALFEVKKPDVELPLAGIYIAKYNTNGNAKLYTLQIRPAAKQAASLQEERATCSISFPFLVRLMSIRVPRVKPVRRGRREKRRGVCQ